MSGIPNSPFNYIQVVIAALGAGYINVITYFIGGSAGATWRIGDDGQVVSFANVLIMTWAPILVLGLIVFLIGRAKKGVCRIAQWVGLIVALASMIPAIIMANDVATGVTLALLHVFTGIAWFFAVHYGNKQIHIASKELVAA